MALAKDFLLVGDGLSAASPLLERLAREAIVYNLRPNGRIAVGRSAKSTAAIVDGGIVQSTVENRSRDRYDGHHCRMGSKAPMAVDKLEHLLAVHVTPVSEQDGDRVAMLAKHVQEVTSELVADVDRGCLSNDADGNTAGSGIHCIKVSPPEPTKVFVPLPRRWVSERSYGWMARLRPLALRYERLSEMPEGKHHVAFSIVRLRKAAPLYRGSS